MNTYQCIYIYFSMRIKLRTILTPLLQSIYIRCFIFKITTLISSRTPKTPFFGTFDNEKTETKPIQCTQRIIRTFFYTCVTCTHTNKKKIYIFYTDRKQLNIHHDFSNARSQKHTGDLKHKQSK